MAVVVAVVCCAAGIFASVASAAGVTTVYKNGFNSVASLTDLKKDGGKDCLRSFDAKRKEMKITVKTGKNTCPWFLPVVGDAAVPSHQVRYKGKIQKSTAGANVRKRAHLISSLRVGGGVRYELRVYPRTERYQLVRFPTSGQFPVGAKSSAIKGLGVPNTVSFRIFSARIEVIINGTKVVDLVDNNVGQVDGRRIQFGAASGGSTNKPVYAAFTDISVGVPSP